jgi:hypothetical protein
MQSKVSNVTKSLPNRYENIKLYESQYKGAL